MDDFSRTHVLPSSFDNTPAPSLYDWKIEQVLGVTFSDDGKDPSLNTVKIKRATLKLEFQGKFVAASVRYPSDRKFKRSPRGKITGFSAGSRQRMIDRFHKIEFRPNTKFLTLTYGDNYPDAQTAKNHLRALFERIRRKWKNKQVSGIWRMEFQERGAIHFHIIFFNMPFWYKDDVQKVWGEIIGEDRPFTRIEAIYSPNGVIYYASKYVAKVQHEESPGFISLTYLHAYNLKYGEYIGRVWGVFNDVYLPYGEKLTIERDFVPAVFYRFRKIAESIYPPIADYLSPGFRIYVNSAIQWRQIARYFFDRQRKTVLLSRLTNNSIPTTL